MYEFTEDVAAQLTMMVGGEASLTPAGELHLDHDQEAVHLALWPGDWSRLWAACPATQTFTEVATGLPERPSSASATAWRLGQLVEQAKVGLGPAAVAA